QHSLLVIASYLRCAGGENQLAAVDVDIGGKERHALLLGGGFHDAHQLIERLGGGLWSALLDKRVRPVEVNKGDRDGTMLGSAAAAHDMRPDCRREATRQQLLGHIRPCAQRYFLEM